VATSDFPPTDQQRAVYEILKERLEAAAEELEGLRLNTLPAFNRLLQQRGLSPVNGGR